MPARPPLSRLCRSPARPRGGIVNAAEVATISFCYLEFSPYQSEKRSFVEQAENSLPDPDTNPALHRAMVAARTADDNRARDIVILDLRELTCQFDYFVICSGTSRRQLHAISEEIDHALEDGLGDKRRGIEGYQESLWIILGLRRRRYAHF